METYLSVKVFASAAGISAQSTYKQLETRFKPYVRVIKGQKKISSEALREFYGIVLQDESGVEQSIQLKTTEKQPESISTINPEQPKTTNEDNLNQPKSTMDEQPNQPQSASEKTLEKTLEVLMEQLRQKDKQIENLQTTLKLAEENLARSQQLHAADKQRLLALESREETPSDAQMENQGCNEEEDIWESTADKEEISEEKGTQAVFVGFTDDETFESNKQVIAPDQEPEVKRGFFSRLWESIIN